MPFLKILFISACCLLAGAACLGAAMSGPAFIFAAPFVALFGWFYMVPIYVFVLIVWELYGSHWAGWRHRIVLMLWCGAVGCAFMLLLGVRGPESGWLWGYGVGGFVSGALGAYLVTVMKREPVQQDAAPDSVPPITEGSVSGTREPPSGT